jgi:hypothetical protein
MNSSPTKSATIARLTEFVDEYAQPAWDGYGADPISTQAVALAIHFVQKLPDGLALPDPSPEPDGSVGLEWYCHDRSRVGVSFGDSDRIAFAWHFATESGHGVATFDGGVVPEPILRLLSKCDVG